MRQARASFGLIVAGLGLALAGLLFSIGFSATPAGAQPQQQRPTLTPLPPTATPRPARQSGGVAVAAGRITGTVIDLISGAPAAGIVVQVGDALLTTDANGNYDRGGLAAGSYQVALVLASGQGVPAQGALAVALEAGATVVQHLSFRSPQPAAPAPTPAQAPAMLPNTGGPAEPGWLAFALGLAVIGLGLRARRAAR